MYLPGALGFVIFTSRVFVSQYCSDITLYPLIKLYNLDTKFEITFIVKFLKRIFQIFHSKKKKEKKMFK